MSPLYMFPPTEEPAADDDLLAGEYALGLHDPGEAAATRLRADTNPALQAAITAWQERLAPIAGMLAEIDPPETLWNRLATELGLPVEAPKPEPTDAEAPDTLMIEQPEPADPTPPAEEPSPSPAPPDLPLPDLTPADPTPAEIPEPAPATPATPTATPTTTPLADPPTPHDSFAGLLIPAVRPEPLPRSAALPARLQQIRIQLRSLPPIRLWQSATAAATLAALALAITLATTRPTPPDAIAAIGVVNAPAPLYLIEADRTATLHVTALALIAVPNGRDLQLWMIPPGSDQPISLGLLPPGGSTFKTDTKPAEGTRFIISLEPRGGAPSGRITGQVLYGGTLANR